MSDTTLTPADIDLSLYPEGTRLDGDGRLLIGGCAVADLAEQYGTPAYLIDEGALRRRAREYVRAASTPRPPGSCGSRSPPVPILPPRSSTATPRPTTTSAPPSRRACATS